MTDRHNTPTLIDGGSSSSTSLSLLDRVRQREEAAWQRLVELYGPLVYRWCRTWGLAATDAADIGQQVCLSIFQSVNQFEHRGIKGAFRAWLKTITRRKVVDHWRCRATDPDSLSSDIAEIAKKDLDDAGSASDEAVLLYHRAAELIKVDFNETTWRAFWMSVVEERPIADIAQELRISPNAVYIAKSRVLTRLRTEFADLLD